MLDELLGTYARLKGLGILPAWAADHGVGMSFHHQEELKVGDANFQFWLAEFP